MIFDGLAFLALSVLPSCDALGPAEGPTEPPPAATVTLEDGVYVIDWKTQPDVDRYDLTIVYDLFPEGPNRTREIEGAVPPVRLAFGHDSLYSIRGGPTDKVMTAALGIAHLELTTVSGGQESQAALTMVPPFPDVRLQVFAVCAVCELGNEVAAMDVDSGVAGFRDSIVVYWSTSPGVDLDAPNRWVMDPDEMRRHPAVEGHSYYYRAIAYAELGDSGLSPEMAVRALSF